MTTKQFLRRIWGRYSKLGRKRKSKQVWRRPTGRDNKMRERRKGYPARVSIGYKQKTKMREKIEEKTPKVVYNLNDLKKADKDDLLILGKVGAKKKIEMMKMAKEMKIKFHKINLDKSLKKLEKSKK